MENSNVRSTVWQDIQELQGNLRNEDRQEVWAATHRDPDTVLEQAVTHSPYCQTIFCDGRVVGIFGVAPDPRANSKGSPWLLASNDIEKMSMYILQNCRYYILQIADMFEILENYVDARNKESQRWLKWCGFVLEDPTPYGPDGMPFHRFWMRRTY